MLKDRSLDPDPSLSLSLSFSACNIETLGMGLGMRLERWDEATSEIPRKLVLQGQVQIQLINGITIFSHYPIFKTVNDRC